MPKRKPVLIRDTAGRHLGSLPPLIPPIGDPQRAAALEFLHLPLTASDEDARRRVGELLRVNDDNVGLNADGRPLAASESWEPHPAWQEYYDRFLVDLDGPWPIMRVQVRPDWAGQDRAQGIVQGWHLVGLEVSPERYKRIVEWRQHPLYGQMPYEALFKGGDPEEPDPPMGRDIDDDALANAARLKLNLWKRAEKQVRGWKRPKSQDFYEPLLMIHEFRRGTLGDLVPLAKAIRWNPSNDPYTKRRFRQWKASIPVQPGEPDVYTQLVLQALTLMQRPKDGTDTARDSTPQAMRRSRRWITRKKRKLVPLNDLQVESYIWWFRNEVTRIIKHEILPDVDAECSHALLEGKSADERWIPSPAEEHESRRWRDNARAFRDEIVHGNEDHQLDIVSKTSANLRALRRRVLKARARLSPLQHQILDLAEENAQLTDFRDIAERLGRGRDTVKNAILRIRRKA